MDELKEKSIASCKLWKDAGKPRTGSIFTIYRRDKALYKNNICTRQGKEREYFTNDLHEALPKKIKAIFLEMLEAQVRLQARQNLTCGRVNGRKAHCETVC